MDSLVNGRGSNLPTVVTTVFADDLTGACEIAGIAHRHGLRVNVAISPGATPRATDLLVADTETRLLSPDDAMATLSSWLQHASISKRAGRVFKKTDSVLRGPVSTELAALAAHTNARRIILVPANPALGRCVRQGRYFIDGVPLDQTSFKFDPHHPARSSEAAALIGVVRGFSAHSLAPTSPLPVSGLIIGDASTPADLALWATRLASDMLPAGSAAFFDALLSRAATHAVQAYPNFADLPLLLVSGTTVPSQRAFLARTADRGLPSIGIPSRTEGSRELWRVQIQDELQLRGRACVYPHGLVDPDPRAALAVRNTLAGLAYENVLAGRARHLVIEGGATAAAIAAALGWQSFGVIHEWAPGVVTVAPDSQPQLRVTLKPGSYPWPEPLLTLIFREHSPLA